MIIVCPPAASIAVTYDADLPFGNASTTTHAASATQRGCRVTVVEQAPTVMGRNAPAPVRDYLLARHQQAGVRVLLNSAIEHAEAGEFLSLTLQNGETLLADLSARYERVIRATGMHVE